MPANIVSAFPVTEMLVNVLSICSDDELMSDGDETLEEGEKINNKPLSIIIFLLLWLILRSLIINWSSHLCHLDCQYYESVHYLSSPGQHSICFLFIHPFNILPEHDSCVVKSHTFFFYYVSRYHLYVLIYILLLCVLIFMCFFVNFLRITLKLMVRISSTSLYVDSTM